MISIIVEDQSKLWFFYMTEDLMEFSKNFRKVAIEKPRKGYLCIHLV
jgi:hypothetical protein